MSLHDIDKKNNVRSNPVPNVSDAVGFRMAHGTTQNHNSIDQAQSDGLKFFERQIIAKQDNFNKAIFGFTGEANKFNLKVARDGVDVLTASDSALTFNSDKSFTVLISDTFTFPSQAVTSGSPVFATSQVIPHGADFIPAVSCFAPLETGASLPVFPPDFPTDLVTFAPNGQLIYYLGLAYMQVYYGVDETNLYLGMNYVNDTGGPVTLPGAPITYYVYTYRASI